MEGDEVKLAGGPSLGQSTGGSARHLLQSHKVVILMGGFFFMSRFTIALLLAMSLLVAGVNAQTVTVAKSGTPDFSTIQAAIDSFDPDPNAGLPNVIQITDAASYEEVITIDLPVTIEGTASSRPIILPLLNTGNDGIVISIPTGTLNEVVLRNLIIIPPLAGGPTDDGITSVGQNLEIVFENVLNAPNDGTNQPVTTTGLEDLDLVALGAVRWGDDCAFLGGTAAPAGDGCNVIFRDTIFTGATGDGLVCSGSSAGFYRIEGGCVFSNCGRLGIQGNGSFIVDAADDPLLVINNDGFAGFWFAGTGSSASPVRNLDGLVVADNDSWGLEQQNGGGLAFNLSNAVFAGNASIGLRIGTVGTTAAQTITNSTFFGNAAAAIQADTGAAYNIVISDSVIAGNGTAASPENAIIIYDSGSTLDISDSAIVTAGAFALNGVGSTGGIGVSSEATVTTTNIINDDPAFFSTTIGARNYVAPTATAYNTANSGGSYLNGGFVVNRSAATAAIDGADVALGDAVAVQNVQTQFGDVSDPDPITGAGSELDALYVSNSQSHLLIGLAGNLEPSGGNNITLLIDTDPLGSNGITTLPSTIDNTGDVTRGFSGMNDDTLPFAADFVFLFENGGFGALGNFITLTGPATVTGENLGDGGAASPPVSGLVDYSTTSARNIQLGLNNSNIAGVAGGDHYHGASAADPAAVTTGYEIAIPLADLGLSEGDLVQVCAYVASLSGFVSNQTLPAVNPPTGNLGGNGTAQDLPAQGMDRVVTFEVGAGQTPVSNFQLYR